MNFVRGDFEDTGVINGSQYEFIQVKHPPFHNERDFLWILVAQRE